MANNNPRHPINLQQIKDEISQVESQGNYKAVNPGKDSSATGKYQFIWKKWGDEIGEVTGAKSRQAFLNSPEAQEKFMDHYLQHIVVPQINILRQQGLGNNFSDGDLGKFIHLEGAAGAARKIRNGTLDQATGVNLSPLQYLHASGSAGGAQQNQGFTEHEGPTNPQYQDGTQNGQAYTASIDGSKQSDKSIYDTVKDDVESTTGMNYRRGGSVYDKGSFISGMGEDMLPDPSQLPGDPGSPDISAVGLPKTGGVSGGAIAGGIGAVTSFASGFLQKDQSDRTGVVDKGLAVGSGALSGAATGASAGAAFGPGGALIGAGAGALLGGVTSLVGANRQQKVLTGAAVKKGQASDTAINNRSVTTDQNPYGTQMRMGGFPDIYKFDEGGIMPQPTGPVTPAPVTGGPAATPAAAPKMTHAIYSQNFNNLVNKYAGTQSNGANGVMSTAPELWGKYQALDKKVGQDAGSVSGQYTTDAKGVNHAAACATVGNSIGYAAGDHEGVYNDPANKGVDLNNHGQGAAGTQNSYDYMSTSKDYKAVNNKTAQAGDAMYYFDKKGNTEHMQRYMADTQEALGRSDQMQSVGRSFQDDGAGNSQIAVYPEQQSQYKLKKGEVYGGMDYATRQKLLSGQAAGDYSKASIYQRQFAMGGYARYEDGSTVQGLPMIPAQAEPQDVAPMQPGQKGQPQGQPQQNMIDIEKGELRIDPKSGKILQEYTGINPKSGTRYQRHNVDPDSEPGANYVHADPGQFIVTVKDAKNFKNADINNDSISKGTIMRNIINNKDKHEGNYRKGSYVVPELPRFDGGGTTDNDPGHKQVSVPEDFWNKYSSQQMTDWVTNNKSKFQNFDAFAKSSFIYDHIRDRKAQEYITDGSNLSERYNNAKKWLSNTFSPPEDHSQDAATDMTGKKQSDYKVPFNASEHIPGTGAAYGPRPTNYSNNDHPHETYTDQPAVTAATSHAAAAASQVSAQNNKIMDRHDANAAARHGSNNFKFNQARGDFSIPGMPDNAEQLRSTAYHHSAAVVGENPQQAKLNMPQTATSGSNSGKASNRYDFSRFAEQAGKYAPALYNIGQGLQGGDKQAHIAANYNPNEGNILGNMPGYMNYEPQRQEALRNADAAQQDNNQRTNSSSIGRSNNNNIYSNTQNNLANIRSQNQQYNNTISEQRGNIYNNLGQQRVAADTAASQYNQGIDNNNEANTGAARNAVGTGMSQMQQIQQNDAKNAQEKDYQMKYMKDIFPLMYPGGNPYMKDKFNYGQNN